jgi:hypothetical protein
MATFISFHDIMKLQLDSFARLRQQILNLNHSDDLLRPYNLILALAGLCYATSKLHEVTNSSGLCWKFRLEFIRKYYQKFIVSVNFMN